MLASTLDEYSRFLCYPVFPFLPSFRLLQPDGGSLEPDATADGCYYVETADEQEELGGPRQEALPLRSLLLLC